MACLAVWPLESQEYPNCDEDFAKHVVVNLEIRRHAWPLAARNVQQSSEAFESEGDLRLTTRTLPPKARRFIPAADSDAWLVVKCPFTPVGLECL